MTLLDAEGFKNLLMVPEETILPGFDLEAFRSGDDDAFKLLFDHYFPAIYFFVRKLLHDNAVCGEIATDTFVRLWANRKKIQNLRHLRSFLYVVARNGARDFHKIETRRVRKLDGVMEIAAFAGADEEYSLIREELLLQLSSAIESLPEKCRKVMELVYLEGKSPKEVAEEMGVTASTVRNQQFRGIAILRQKLTGKQLLILAALISAAELH